MVEITNTTKSAINETSLKRLAGRFLKEHKAEKKEVSIVFVGEQKMRCLNAAYRKKDSATDVLAFSGEDDFLGEIIICYRQIERQGKIFGTGAKKELEIILVHGLLHLMGYTDDTDLKRRRMMELTEQFLGKKL